MAAGTYKNGVAIIVTYQAVNVATGKTVTMDVYDETHAKDVAKCVAAMTEFAATGRYYATFTPDAEGEWLVVMKNTTDNNGEVLKSYEVAGHDLDSIGDAVAAITAAGPTKAEMDTAHGLLATPAQVATALETYNGPTMAEMDTGHALLATVAKQDIIDTVVDGIQTDLSNATDGLGAIKTAVDALGSPAMVG